MKFLVITAVLLFLSACSVSLEPSPQAMRSVFNDAYNEYKAGDCDKTQALLEPLLKYNYPTAHGLTAFCYYYSQDSDVDHKKVLEHAKIAAVGGDVNSQRLLSFMYGNGDQVPLSYSLQLYWAKQAAENGDHEAMALVGLMYYRGERAEHNLEQARSYFQRSYLLGSEAGKSGLDSIDNGILKEERRPNLVKLEILAAENDPEAQWLLARWFRASDHVSKQWLEVYWLRRAAKLGHTMAIARLVRIDILGRPALGLRVPMV